ASGSRKSNRRPRSASGAGGGSERRDETSTGSPTARHPVAVAWSVAMAVLENAPQPAVLEHAVGVHLGLNAAEVLPARIKPGQLPWSNVLQLAPVRPTLMLAEDLIGRLEVFQVALVLERVHSHEHRVALVRRAEEDVVLPREANLNGHQRLDVPRASLAVQ